MKNAGTDWEKRIQEKCDAYARKGILRAKKVCAPVVVIRRRMIFQTNPFPDFVGSWTRKGARMIAFEVKSTKVPRLEFGEKGLKKSQQAALHNWHNSGAFAFLLWIHAGEMALIPWEWIRPKTITDKSLKWGSEMIECPEFDFEWAMGIVTKS